METQPEIQGQNVEDKLKQVLTSALYRIGNGVWELWLNNIWGPNYRPNQKNGISTIMPEILEGANKTLKRVAPRDAVSQAAFEIFGIFENPEQK